MPWRPSRPGEWPTLGWEVLDWISDFLAAPDRGVYEPFVPTREQADFVLRFYRLDPVSGKRVTRRGVLSRPRGWGKSPFLAALACAEALGPVVPDGWSGSGQPVGVPWSTRRTPLVQIAAVSERQTANSWAPLLEMLRNGPAVDGYPGLEPMDTFVNLPRGRIEPITSSANTTKGNPAVFGILDQTEEWTKSNGGHRLSEVMLNNATKVGGSTVESPNAFVPGQESVAELTAEAWRKMREGRTRIATGVLYDHREAPGDTDLTDRESLLSGLAYAYGDSADVAGGWVDLERVLARMWEPDLPPQLARADFLNQITHAADSWLSQPEWAACARPAVVVGDGDEVTLGFDGSRRRQYAVTDATALIGCRVSDGHIFEIGVWEEPDAVDDWQVPSVEVDAAVRTAFGRYNVVGFYADPALWESYVASWEAEFGARMPLKVSRDRPIEWRVTGAKIVRAVGQFHSAVVDREMTHDGAFTLTRHVLNARRHQAGRHGFSISKEHHESSRKIDAAVAAVLAWQARLDAVAAAGASRKARVGVGYGF